MMSNNLPLVTPVPRNGNGMDNLKHTDVTRLSELRDELSLLSETIAGVAANRLAEVEQLASEGTANLRSSIETRPWAAMAIAGTVGALLAVMIIPKSSRGFRYNDTASYNVDDIAASVRRAAARVDTQPITSRLERLVDSISSIDPSALTSSPAYDTVKTWVGTIANGLRKT
jgi:ElaB/YqjD/DUF883 family membrane-anchored ribosome-binding protein